MYSDGNPSFIEADIFKTFIPLSKSSKDQAKDQAERTNDILAFCRVERSRQEIQKLLNLSGKRYFRTTILNPLVEQGLLKMTIPDKPTSPKQKYYADNWNN